jgi:hypothetical protein
MLYNQIYSHFPEMTFIFLLTGAEREREREREREKQRFIKPCLTIAYGVSIRKKASAADFWHAICVSIQTDVCRIAGTLGPGGERRRGSRGF